MEENKWVKFDATEVSAIVYSFWDGPLKATSFDESRVDTWVEIAADSRFNHVKGIGSDLILSRILCSLIGESQYDRVSQSRIQAINKRLS